jgi:hypothetical protein
MATQLALPSAAPSTASSLVQKAQNAKLVVAQPKATQTYSLKAAKQLIGSFPHARPPEPETYAAAISATLAQYPQGVVADCVDPRVGLARDREFPPTVKAVVDWCDARVAYYETIAKYQARETATPEREFTEEDRALGIRFLANLAEELKARQHARPGGLPTTMGDHIRKAIEERPRAGLSPTPEDLEDRMRKAEALGREIDRIAAQAAE